MTKPRRRRRWPAVLVGSATMLALLGFLGCRFVGHLFYVKVAAAVRTQLGAQFDAGSVIYRPPYSFYARDVVITRDQNGQRVELMRAAGLAVKLAAFPRKGTPLLVDQLVVNAPEVQWLPRGGGSPSTAPAATPVTAPVTQNIASASQPSRPPTRISDKLRIANLQIYDARIIYDDPRAGGRDISLEHIQLDMKQGVSPAVYDCRLLVSDGAALSLRAEGEINDDLLSVQLPRLEIKGRIGPLLRKLPLTDGQRQELAVSGPDGRLSITGAASFPLRQFRRASYQLTVDLEDGAVRVPRWKASVQKAAARLTLRSGDAPANGAQAPAVHGTIERIELAAGNGRLRVDGGTILVLPNAKTWSVSKLVGHVEMARALPFSGPRSGWFFDKGEFSGPVEFTAAASGPFKPPPGASPLDAIQHELLAYPHGVSLRPAKFPLAVDHVSGGPIAFRGGVITFANLTGTYGKDSLLLRSARLTLQDAVRHISLEDLKTQVKFQEIAGTLIFRQPNAAYPGAIGKTVAQLRPTGPFVIGGGSWYAMNRPPASDRARKLKPDYFIRLIGDGGSFALSDYKIPLTGISGQATITPMSVRISDFRAKSLDGSAWADGQIVPGKPFVYQGTAEVRDIDLRKLAQILPLGEPARARLTGRGYARATLRGASSAPRRDAAQLFTADGEFEVLHGDFWSVPTVSEVASQVKRPEELGIGDAAGVVHIQNAVATLQNVAINSPLLGLQGSGTIRFDKSLNLSVTVAPLGDWKDKMRQLNIGVVSDVAGEVLGAVQQVLNGAQGALLYQFRITGTLKQPINNLVPAPAITEPLALLFGHMVRGESNGQLLTEVRRGVNQPAASTAQPAAAHQKAR